MVYLHCLLVNLMGKYMSILMIWRLCHRCWDLELVSVITVPHILLHHWIILRILDIIASVLMNVILFTILCEIVLFNNLIILFLFHEVIEVFFLLVLLHHELFMMIMILHIWLIDVVIDLLHNLRTSLHDIILINIHQILLLNLFVFSIPWGLEIES